MGKLYPKIKEFSELGNGIWRIDWRGAVEKNLSVESEYAVQVVVSRLKSNWQHSDIATDDAVEDFTRRCISIGVGQLPFVQVGSFWKDGQQLPSLAGEPKSFDIEISSASTGFARATDKVGGQTVIPFNDHKVHGAGKGSWCLCLPYGNDSAGIIIPAIEIIRFYYATSTRLSKAVFNGDFAFSWDELVNPDTTGMRGNRCVVHRRRDVEDDDCWTIGRIQNDPNAYQGIIDVIHSMLVEHANNQPAHPKCRFPFVGKTTIRARCKQIGYNHKRWLVLSLISCSGPFPYNELEVVADNGNTPANPETDIPESEKKPAWPGEKQPNVADTTMLQSGAEPEADTRNNRIEVPEERFSAISGKSIIKTLKDQCLYKSGSLKTIVKQVTPTALGTGDGVYSATGVAPASIVVVDGKRKQSLPADFNTLVEMLEALNGESYPGASGQLHVFPSAAGLIDAPLTNGANKRQWSYLNFKKRLRRQFMVADIVVEKYHFCLIEVEGRPNSDSDAYRVEVIYHDDWHKPNSAELIALVKSLTKGNGRMKNVGRLPCGLKRLGTGLLHRWESADEYATRVVEAVQKASE